MKNAEEVPQPKSILIVDPDLTDVQELKKILSQAGYEVHHSIDSTLAFQHLKKKGADLIITEVDLPKINGYDFVKTLRNHPTQREIPVIMLTRRKSVEDIRSAVDCGVNDYAIKPLDEQIMLDKVDVCLRGEGSEQHTYELNISATTGTAVLETECRIIALSEAGITIQVPIYVAENAPLKLNSDIFKAIGIRRPMMKWVSCEAGKKDYTLRMIFMGVEDKDLQRIRMYIHKEALKRRK